MSLRAQPLAPLNVPHRHEDALHGRKRALPPVGSMSQPSLQRSPRLTTSFPASVPVREANGRREVMPPLRAATTDGLSGRHNWSPPVLRPNRPSTEPGRSRAARALTESSNSPSSTAADEGGAVKQEVVKQELAKQEVKLLYDSILNCYYDPQSNKYFELR